MTGSAGGAADSEPLCPSARAGEGRVLLGVAIGRRGLGYATPAVEVDTEFLTQAGDRPEERFRFAAPCAKGGCHNWNDGRCELIHQFLDEFPLEQQGDHRAPPQEQGDLPRCAIRARCRWFAQAGRDACVICPMVRNPAGLRPTAWPAARLVNRLINRR